MAQRDSSLTQDFAKLSAKERARMAAHEEQDAAADTAFQARMKQAELRFQQGAFQNALDLYRQARSMRPYNVHPKVKIQRPVLRSDPRMICCCSPSISTVSTCTPQKLEPSSAMKRPTS